MLNFGVNNFVVYVKTLNGEAKKTLRLVYETPELLRKAKLGDSFQLISIIGNTISDNIEKAEDNATKSKAFSYFSVVTKNWFIAKAKKKSKRNRQELDIMELPSDLELRHVSTINPYLKDRAVREFWTLLTKEVESWDNQEKMKENEKKVLAAVQILMESCEDIEIFNKKAIYLYLREITGLNTKQVVNNLNKMRIKYRSFKVKWNSGDL
jgi:hypothetical protein